MKIPPPTIEGLTTGRMLGQGGMGAVFAALDDHGERVAVKVIAGTGPCARARARFATEVAALSLVDDPHVVRLHRTGEVGGAPYAVLERIGGFGLDQIRGGVPWRVAVHLGRQLARAIAAVHRAGLIHRDIKPSNVMVTRRGHLTLIDFGLARRVEDVETDLAVGSGPGASHLTEPGICMGTPRYLAPEVARGEPATARSDFHAFGLVMAHLLGASLEDEPPEELLDLVSSCLEHDPANRPASADAIVAVLDALPARASRLRRNAHDLAPPVAPEPTRRTGPARPFAAIADAACL